MAVPLTRATTAHRSAARHSVPGAESVLHWLGEGGTNLDGYRRVGAEANQTRVAGVSPLIDVDPHRLPRFRVEHPHPVTRERLAPDVKEGTERRTKGVWGFYVDQAA